MGLFHPLPPAGPRDPIPSWGPSSCPCCSQILLPGTSAQPLPRAPISQWRRWAPGRSPHMAGPATRSPQGARPVSTRPGRSPEPAFTKRLRGAELCSEEQLCGVPGPGLELREAGTGPERVLVPSLRLPQIRSQTQAVMFCCHLPPSLFSMSPLLLPCFPHLSEWPLPSPRCSGPEQGSPVSSDLLYPLPQHFPRFPSLGRSRLGRSRSRRCILVT